jgi:polysaccharide biosynthesis/export protein
MKYPHAVQTRRRRAASGSIAAGLLACGLFLTGCEPGSGLPTLPTTPPGPYRLGVDEQVRIITFGDEHLTGQFRVNDRGDIAIPLLGPIRAEGLTTTELEASIAQRLREQKVLLNPSVSVEVLGYRPVFILGEVSKPGQYSYQPGMTVLTAVSIAGGFTYRAQDDYASILRTINGKSVEGRVTRGTRVQPGDVIDILPRYF